jgi:hypothetical protein
MLEHDMLRQVLYTKAITVVNTNNFLCKIGEEPFVPPTDGTLYGEFWFRTADAEQLELGSMTGQECSPGIAQFTIFAPEKDGDGPSLKLAGALKHYLNRQQWIVPPDGYVNLQSASVKQLGIKNGKKVVVVDCHFDFYYNNPAAAPT